MFKIRNRKIVSLHASSGIGDEVRAGSLPS